MFHCPFAVACAMQCRTCHNNLWGKKISFTRGTVIVLRPLFLRSELRESGGAHARREGVFYISSSEVLWKITVFQLVNNYLLCCAFLRSAFVVV